MTIIFDPTVAPGKLPQVFGKLKQDIEKAHVYAKNKAADGMKTDGLKEITATFTVKRSAVAKKIGIKKARSFLDEAMMYSKGRPLRSYYMKHKRNQRAGSRGAPGVFLQVLKGGGGRKFTGSGRHSKAFMATMPNGMEGIFRRRKGARTDSGKNEIHQLHSPGAVQMLDREEVRTAIIKNARVRFEKELDHQISRALKGTFK